MSSSSGQLIGSFLTEKLSRGQLIVIRQVLHLGLLGLEVLAREEDARRCDARQVRHRIAAGGGVSFEVVESEPCGLGAQAEVLHGFVDELPIGRWLRGAEGRGTGGVLPCRSAARPTPAAAAWSERPTCASIGAANRMWRP